MMNECNEQLEATNELLLNMIKNQKEESKRMFKMFMATIICMTLLLIAMVIGFFCYESQFEVSDAVTTETITTQEVSGDDSTINNVEGNQYNDNATHNEK